MKTIIFEKINIRFSRRRSLFLFSVPLSDDEKKCFTAVINGILPSAYYSSNHQIELIQEVEKLPGAPRLSGFVNPIFCDIVPPEQLELKREI